MSRRLSVIFVGLSAACASPHELHEFESEILRNSGGASGQSEGSESLGGAKETDEADGHEAPHGPEEGDNDEDGEECIAEVCECFPGFLEELGQCYDVDECELAISACDDAAACQNELGGYRCSCPAGAFGDGLFCSNSDACEGAECGSGNCQLSPLGASCDCPLGSTGASCDVSCQGTMPSEPLLRSWVAESLGDFEGDWAALLSVDDSISARRWATVEGENEKVKSLEGLECWTTLKQVELANQAIDDFTPLASLTRLESLDLSCNPGANLFPLAGLYRLSSLYLDHSKCPELQNEPLELSSLSSLLQLKELVLGGQEITDWSVIAKMKSLVRIHARQVNGNDLRGNNLPATVLAVSLPQCGLQSIPDLSHLTRVVELNLAENSIKDPAPLLNLHYGRGAKIRINGNPVSCSQLAVVEQELSAHSVEIYSDCPAN